MCWIAYRDCRLGKHEESRDKGIEQEGENAKEKEYGKEEKEENVQRDKRRESCQQSGGQHGDSIAIQKPVQNNKEERVLRYGYGG